MKNVIVTGANGFVGNHLVKLLSDNSLSVIAIIKDEKENIDAIKSLPNVRIVYCELDNITRLPDMLDGATAATFFHLAWVGSAGPLRADYNIQLDNARYTCDAVNAAKQIGCSRFIFAASIMQYELIELMETTMAPGAGYIYGCGKMVANYMAKVQANKIGIDYLSIVISNIYGPGERSERLVNTTIHKLVEGKQTEFTAGNQMYDFIYVEDAVRAFCDVEQKGIPNKSYYLGNLSPRPLKEFLLEIGECVAPEAELGLGIIPFHGVDLDYSKIDTDALTRDTGFKPKHSFKDGIKKTAQWLEENP